MKRQRWLIYCLDDAEIAKAGPFTTETTRDLTARALVRTYGATSLVMARVETNRKGLYAVRHISLEEQRTWE